MGRKKKNTAFDDFVEIVSWMPWWAGVALAIVTYFVFHAFTYTPPTTGNQNIGAVVQRSMIGAIAFALQIVAPFACLLGALLSFIGRRKRTKLVADAADAADASSLNGITWLEFELLVGEAFRLRGYSVVEMGGNSPDGGVDLVLKKGGHTLLVQCKQWKTALVDVKVVRELYGVIAHRGANGGFVVTSGRFTSAAREFAKGKFLHLVDGEELHDMIRSAQHARAAVPRASPLPAAAPVQAAQEVRAPTCPACNSSMVLRTAKRGATAGSSFWGCSQYPSCRGTRAA